MGAAQELLTVVEAQTSRVFDEAQSQAYAYNAKLFKGVVYSSTLDARTCAVCGMLDGTVYWMDSVPKGEEGETYASKPALPMHPNCHCVYVPVVKEWQALPIDDKEFSNSARKLLNGKTPKTKTWEEWFASQRDSVQKKILGPTRYDLWRNGRVGLEDLTVDAKIVPLKDLAAKKKVRKQVAEMKEMARR